LLEAWWEKKTEYISPEKLLTGNDLILKFDLISGPVIGKLLSEILEGQATGEIIDKEDAYKFAGEWLAANYGYISSKTG
jgi:poly(A) polymerase